MSIEAEQGGGPAVPLAKLVGSSELATVSSFFHSVASAIPKDQEIVTAQPDDLVGEVLRTMQENDFSQVPVVHKQEVLGIFSLRSFARNALEQTASRSKVSLEQMSIHAFLDRPKPIAGSDEVAVAFDLVDRYEAALVIDGRDWKIITAADLLRWQDQVARPFFRLGEIELSLRGIIRRTLSDDEIATCATRALAHYYKGSEENLPRKLESMTFGELKNFCTDGRTWELLSGALGVDREFARSRLEPIGEARNTVFHFRGELTDQDWSNVNAARSWLHDRFRMLS